MTNVLDLGEIEAAPRVKRPVDIELIVQWALEPRGRLPFDRADDKELAFDRGVTVKPRKKPRGSWALAEACAGLRLGSGRPLHAYPTAPRPDAERIIDAIRQLPPAAAATVIACGRGRIRPDWMEGVEPRQVVKKRSHRKCRNGQPRTRLVWEPCTPDEIRAAHAIYSRWHAALLLLADRLRGTLERFEINGFGAPAEPWESELQKTA